MFKKALVSVSDKTGLVNFLKPLVNRGLKIVSTGGTREHLLSHGIKAEDISELTQFKEVLGGRVKTLHPLVFISLLARQWVASDQRILKKYNLTPFDLVICNLYPFKKNMSIKEDKQLVEFIDIGGPSLLRASAKNYFSITTLCKPKDYKTVKLNCDIKQRQELAIRAFEYVSSYDILIQKVLKQRAKKNNIAIKENPVNEKIIKARFIKSLRYGENPHQLASWYQTQLKGLHQCKVLQGKPISFNNLLDLQATTNALKAFKEPTCVCVKHTNPCSIASSNNILQALKLGLKSDPVSVFGGIVGVNQKIDSHCATQLISLFLECIVAPDYSKSALKILNQKTNLRVCKWPNLQSIKKQQEIRFIYGGLLFQSQDMPTDRWQKSWKIVGKNPPLAIRQDLLFALKTVTYLKSNAIAIVKNKTTLGLGMGQVNRIDALKQALQRATRYHKKQITTRVLASDGFFPFTDAILLAHQNNIKWIIQPGGSIKDKEIIQKCSKLGINMILTLKRHFLH